jgi:hypothetical protein
MQRCYQKFICKVKQNFRESTLGNTFIVHDDTKKFLIGMLYAPPMVERKKHTTI